MCDLMGGNMIVKREAMELKRRIDKMEELKR